MDFAVIYAALFVDTTLDLSVDPYNALAVKRIVRDVISALRHDAAVLEAHDHATGSVTSDQSEEARFLRFARSEIQ